MSTDIDRKLAIYYHPLFQEIIKRIIKLFQVDSEVTEIGLLQFLQFNLKLQKALLPSFERQNALVSGLNDWVKEVAQCLSYEGMVSTGKCVDVNQDNFESVVRRQLEDVKIKLIEEKEQYLKIMKKLQHHDAYKLLGVRINKQVFSKFMFDLCSTWCQFLDIQLFSYFLLAIYIQISQGNTLEESCFRHTNLIETVNLGFMEQFQDLKSNYSRVKKKDLRYYRAWCQWNYLRVNQIGEGLILQLDHAYPNDNRILQIALIFQRGIQIINDEITNQNPVQQNIKPKQIEPSKQFLTMKKINIKSNKQTEKKLNELQIQEKKQQNQLQQQNYDVKLQSCEHDFEIEIDSDGNMYLKKIVKLPIVGKKIEPQLFENKQSIKKAYLERKKDQCRAVSNLYRKMQSMKVRLEHNINNDYYSFKKDPMIQKRDNFYLQQDQYKNKMGINHKRRNSQNSINIQIDKEQQINNYITRQNNQKLIQENHKYIYQVLAPSFLTTQEVIQDKKKQKFAKKDPEKFYERMKKLLKKEDKKIARKQKKQKMRKYRNTFKNKKQKQLFQSIFIDYHKNQVKKIKNNNHL